jgi:Flp pilus assembly protein TadG
VEFALVMVIFFVIVYGIIEVSRLVFINAEMGNAAREGAHYLSLNSRWGGDVSATATAVVATAQARARQRLVMADRTTTQVDVPVYNTCTFCVVEVTVSYPWAPIVRFPWLPNIQLESTATKLIENGTP